MASINLAELNQGRRKVGERELRIIDQVEINRLVLKILGILAEASSQECRRRVLSKAQRMLGTR
jgi:hypothetical protein